MDAEMNISEAHKSKKESMHTLESQKINILYL